jgi:hypothetical protein
VFVGVTVGVLVAVGVLVRVGVGPTGVSHACVNPLQLAPGTTVTTM